jgi:hypothetical protein
MINQLFNRKIARCDMFLEKHPEVASQFARWQCGDIPSIQNHAAGVRQKLAGKGA